MIFSGFSQLPEKPIFSNIWKIKKLIKNLNLEKMAPVKHRLYHIQTYNVQIWTNSTKSSCQLFHEVKVMRNCLMSSWQRIYKILLRNSAENSVRKQTTKISFFVRINFNSSNFNKDWSMRVVDWILTILYFSSPFIGKTTHFTNEFKQQVEHTLF